MEREVSPMSSTIRLYARSWHFWLVVALLVAGTILHYPKQFPFVGEDAPSSWLGLERHSFERVIFLVAIVYGGLMLGVRTGWVIAGVALVAMLPRVIWVSKAPADAALETAFVVALGVVVNGWFDAYQSQKKRYERTLSELHAAQAQLRARIQAAELSGQEQERSEAALGSDGDTARRLAALSAEIEKLAASTGSRFEGLSQEIEGLQGRLDKIFDSVDRSK
jgi:hypothetical protein